MIIIIIIKIGNEINKHQNTSEVLAKGATRSRQYSSETLKSVVKSPFFASREQLEFNTCEQRNPGFLKPPRRKSKLVRIIGRFESSGVKLQWLTGEGK